MGSPSEATVSQGRQAPGQWKEATYEEVGMIFPTQNQVVTNVP